MGVLMCPFPPKKLRSFTVLTSTGGVDDRPINLLHFVIHNFKGGQSFQWNSREQKCDQNLYPGTFEVKTGHFVDRNPLNMRKDWCTLNSRNTALLRACVCDLCVCVCVYVCD